MSGLVRSEEGQGAKPSREKAEEIRLLVVDVFKN